MTVKAGDFVTVRKSGEKGRLLGIYAAHDGTTLHVKLPTGEVHIDMPAGASHDEYLDPLPKKAA